MDLPILVVLLFGFGALSICGMVILAASMRAMMPPPMPDISRYARNTEYGRPMRPLDLEKLYQCYNQQTNRPTPEHKEE